MFETSFSWVIALAVMIATLGVICVGFRLIVNIFPDNNKVWKTSAKKICTKILLVLWILVVSGWAIAWMWTGWNMPAEENPIGQLNTQFDGQRYAQRVYD